MRIIFKILLFPITLILTVFAAFSRFLIEKCAIILNIFSGFCTFAMIITLLQYFFGWPFGVPGNVKDLQSAIFAAVFAFILSPYGLPTVLMWIIEKLDDLNQVIKDI